MEAIATTVAFECTDLSTFAVWRPERDTDHTDRVVQTQLPGRRDAFVDHSALSGSTMNWTMLVGERAKACVCRDSASQVLGSDFAFERGKVNGKLCNCFLFQGPHNPVLMVCCTRSKTIGFNALPGQTWALVLRSSSGVVPITKSIAHVFGL